MTQQQPNALLIRTAGTNCDAELERALRTAGALVTTHHIDQLARNHQPLETADIIAIPGGFSHGDDIAAGRVLAARIRHTIWPPFREAIQRGALVLGICNGFQVLTQLGLLPGCPPEQLADTPPRPSAALAENESGRFIDRWCTVTIEPNSNCLWTKGLSDMSPDALLLPVAHAEGRLVIAPPDDPVSLARRGLIAIRYAPGDNPNGSPGDIAGLTDPTGRILGMMPHPERYLTADHHPSRGQELSIAGATLGLRIFQNAVEAAGCATDAHT